MKSPVIVFAFNRLNPLMATIDSLKKNPEAKDSDLIVYVDGFRQDKIGEEEKVQAVQKFVLSISGFKSVVYNFSTYNKGLAPSIINGVSEVMNRYGKAIIVEDDLVVSNSFLAYMNQMLDLFKDDQRIFQISGFSPRMSNKTPIGGDVYLNGRAQCWSWATWKDRWQSVDWQVSDYESLIRNRTLRRKFNSHGSDLFGMLRRAMKGEISSWYVRFCYEMHRQGKYTVCPKKSLVRNDGFGENATHCLNYNRYKINFESVHNGEFKVQCPLEADNNVLKESIKFWTIRYRIYGKIMTYLQKIFSLV